MSILLRVMKTKTTFWSAPEVYYSICTTNAMKHGHIQIDIHFYQTTNRRSPTFFVQVFCYVFKLNLFNNWFWRVYCQMSSETWEPCNFQLYTCLNWYIGFLVLLQFHNVWIFYTVFWQAWLVCQKLHLSRLEARWLDL